MERKFIELVEHNIYSRGNIIDVAQYQNTRRNYEAYTSLFMFKEDVVDYVKNNISVKTKAPSIEGYIGECSAKYLWIDIDVDGDIQLATKYMLEVVDRIEKEYRITYKSLTVFFSGNKGFHIGIPSKCFGGDEFSGDMLPAGFKLMVKVITNNFKGIDYKIYNTSRIFRCPYSKHPKSGLFKIPVSIPLLIQDGTGLMLQCAEFCSRHCDYSLAVEFSDSLKKLFDDCITQCTNSVDIFADEEGFDTPLAVKENRSIFRMPEKNGRNDLMYKMAYRLFCQKGLKVTEISDIMKFIYEVVNEHSNKKGLDRYSEMEFKISLNSAYQRTRLRVVKDVKAKSFHSLAKAMYDKIKASVYAKTIIQEVTDDLRGGWMLGNSYALIGKAGTMKSYYMQEEMISKAIEEKKDSLIVSLEMSEVTLYDRLWMAVFYKSMSEMIESGELNDSNIVQMQDTVQEIVGNHLHIYTGVDIEPEDLTGIIKSKEDEIKRKISIVGVDSVSGMKLYNDSEAITALKLSKGIKESAKDTNTAILTINHANSSCAVTERDVAQYVRGGQKFVDNADAYLSFSSVVDMSLSNMEKSPPDLIYAKGVKYVRFINKRGSGNTINKIIRFGINGRTEVLQDSPSSYEVSIPSVGWYG